MGGNCKSKLPFAIVNSNGGMQEVLTSRGTRWSGVSRGYLGVGKEYKGDPARRGRHGGRSQLKNKIAGDRSGSKILGP